MVKKILLSLVMLLMCLTAYSQTYTITEAELNQLEAIILEQARHLTEQANDLTALRSEILEAKEALTRHLKSFNEYESAALKIQKSLRDELSTNQRRLKGWQIALPITGAALLTGGLLIGIFCIK